MYSDDRALMFSAFDSGWDVSNSEEVAQRLADLGTGVEEPEGSKSPKPYSVFMDVYAGFARLHMKTFGTTQEQFAAVAAKNHAHSAHNPLAQYRDAMSVDQVLAALPITYPLTCRCAPRSRTVPRRPCCARAKGSSGWGSIPPARSRSRPRSCARAPTVRRKITRTT